MLLPIHMGTNVHVAAGKPTETYVTEFCYKSVKLSHIRQKCNVKEDFNYILCTLDFFLHVY